MPESDSKANKHRISHRISEKIINVIFVIVFSIIIFTLLLASQTQYCSGNRANLPNIICLLVGLLLGGLFYIVLRYLKFGSENKVIIPSAFAVLFIIQIIILVNSYFYTAWDAGVINSLADNVALEGTLPAASNSTYLLQYPNNTFLVGIISLIKSVPFFGSYHLFLLTVNALLVNLAGLLTCISIKRLISQKAALFSIVPISILIVLSPWIIIPYSDTFAILIPILIFYIYQCSITKWWKYVIISFLSLVGFFIKPTVIIISIAILIATIIRTNWRTLDKVTINSYLKKALWLVVGLILAFSTRAIINKYTNYSSIADNSVPAVSFVHYLAMGQNDETCGVYSGKDAEEYIFGKSFELNKFATRLFSRTPIEQANFFTKKLLVNYNDGTFAWSQEGNFYANIPERNTAISDLLENYYYRDGRNYKIYLTVCQIAWIPILFCCLFIKNQKRESLIIKISLIGIFLFVMLFEARARYLFCFAPIFILAAALGFERVKNAIERYISSRHRPKSAKD